MEMKSRISSINNLNIIINDADCMNSFIDEVCEKLKRFGIFAKTTRNCEGIDIDDACIITLDQQLNSGAGIVLVGAYHNNLKNDKSDCLLLCSKAGFENCGFNVDNIVCGIRGYREDNNSVTIRIPSKTEELTKKSSCFVKIALGTEARDSSLVADAIVNSLSRFSNYVESLRVCKYIYRGTDKLNFDKLVEIFDADGEDINKINGFNYNNNLISIDFAYISPKVETISQYDKNINVIIEKE